MPDRPAIAAPSRGTAPASRGTARRATPRQPKPRVQNEGPSLILDFDVLIFDYEIVQLLFRDGRLPAGYELTSKDRTNPALRWTLRWAHLDRTLLTSYGEALWNHALGGGDEFAEDTAARIKWQRLEEEAIADHNKMYVPALGMTGGQALERLAPGLYVASPNKGIHPVPPLAPNATFPPSIDLVKQLQPGAWFVYVGPGRRGKHLEMYEIADGLVQFPREMIWYVLHEGDSLFVAAKKFCERWDEINLKMIGAFAMALTTAPSTGPRADLAEAAFGPAVSAESRSLAKEGEAGWGGFASKIDPVEAAQVGVVVASRPWEGLKGLLPSDEDDMHQEAVNASDAVVAELQRRMAQMTPTDFQRQLKTGEMGEAIVKATLKLRGYEVVDLQNPSGQGIDIVGMKVKGGRVSIIAFEVKSSIEDNPGRLSEAQKNPREFVRSRLDAVVARAGFYKNVSQEKVEIAQHLKEALDAGHPIGTVKVDVHWAKMLTFKVNFTFWRGLAKAQVVPREQEHVGARER